MSLIPEQLAAGLSVSFLVSLADYSAPEWQAKLILRGPASIDLDSVAEDSSHRFTKTPTTTAQWVAGDYWYSLRVTDGTDIHEVGSGRITITPDLEAQSSGYDGSTHPEKVLAAIEAVIEGRASKDQDSYRINNRELRRTPISQLLKLRDQYRREVKRLNDARRGKNVLGRQILARFGHGV